MPYSDFLESAEIYHRRLVDLEKDGKLFLSDELSASSIESGVMDGVKQLGLFHDAAVVKVQEGVIWTEDMNLLYYYRNRLSGYGISLLARMGGEGTRFRKNDSQGFLA